MFQIKSFSVYRASCRHDGDMTDLSETSAFFSLFKHSATSVFISSITGSSVETHELYTSCPVPCVFRTACAYISPVPFCFFGAPNTFIRPTPAPDTMAARQSTRSEDVTLGSNLPDQYSTTFRSKLAQISVEICL